MDRQLYRALRHGRQERDELRATLVEAMVTTYVETLADLAESYGYDLEGGPIDLSDDALRSIVDVARDWSEDITDTYNEDLKSFLERNSDRDRGDVLADFEAWASDRASHKAEQLAIDTAYASYSDATTAFFIENGLEPEFEFGGHPELGDEPPECETCQALEESNPHPLSRVLEVGSPHSRCRQNWHPNIDPEQLPDELLIGGGLSGILGLKPLVQRVDDRADAARIARGEE